MFSRGEHGYIGTDAESDERNPLCIQHVITDTCYPPLDRLFNIVGGGREVATAEYPPVIDVYDRITNVK